MAAIQEPHNLGDLLKYEEDCLFCFREQVTVATAEVMRSEEPKHKLLSGI